MTFRHLPRALGPLSAFLAASLLAAMAPTATDRPEVTAFVNVTVVPMDTERVLTGYTVVVQGRWITAFGPTEKVAIPAGAVRVEGRGKVLIPGLADMHAHFREGFREASPAGRLLRKEQQLFFWLAHGLTTVRIMDHDYDDRPSNGGMDGLHLRARAAAGELLIPRISTSGYLMGGLDRTQRGLLRLDEVVPAVATYKAAGFDFIKPYYSEFPQTQKDEPAPILDSLAATARRAGLPLAGHTVGPLARALATYRSIEHLTGYVDQEGFAPTFELDDRKPLAELAPKIRELAVATQRAGVWNCPTLYNDSLNHRSPEFLALVRRVVQALQDAGAGLLLGSDRLQEPRREVVEHWAELRDEGRLEIMYGDANATHRELRMLVEAGLTPYQALATGTRNVAAYFGILDSAGTIAVGKRADLVLLAGNPLADIRQTERIAGVMVDGHWLDRAALDRRIADFSAWVSAQCPDSAMAAGAKREVDMGVVTVTRGLYIAPCLDDR